jgi:uncharacterized protein (DUF2141 family)
MKANYKVLALVLISIVSLSSFKSDPPANSTAKIEVSINIKQRLLGKISIALCNDEKSFMSSAYKVGAMEMPMEGPVSFTFENIPVGTYSVRVFQDTDGDGKLTSGDMGIPAEPFGFSQNPSIQFGPPTFKKTSFEVKENVSVSINLLKFDF